MGGDGGELLFAVGADVDDEVGVRGGSDEGLGRPTLDDVFIEITGRPADASTTDGEEVSA